MPHRKKILSCIISLLLVPAASYALEEDAPGSFLPDRSNPNKITYPDKPVYPDLIPQAIDQDKATHSDLPLENKIKVIPEP